MAQSGIALIAGLGNPGSQYAATRHNAGFWFIERLQRQLGFRLAGEIRFKAEVGSATFNGRAVRIMVPNTFMNLSGEAIAPLASFYRIPAQHILVIHDELDLAPGVARLKLTGGHGGHNGLRDIVSRLGTREFARLRIGIGHPGPGRDTSGYVLRKPDAGDRMRIESAMEDCLEVFDLIIAGDFQKAMTRLHTDTTAPTSQETGSGI